MQKETGVISAGLVLGVVVVLLNGCASTGKIAQPAPAATDAEKTAAVQKPAEKTILEGKVVETMNAAGYTYIHLEKDGKNGWVAVPPVQVAVGQEIKVRPGMEMGQFTSRSLNRTFDNILFSAGLASDTATPAAGHMPLLPQGHPAMNEKMSPAAHTMGNMGQPATDQPVISGKVLETMDSGGYTYINLESAGKKVWAAVPNTEVTVGQEIKLQSGQEMTNFKSKSLDRIFDSVIFSGGVIPAAK
ncbi:MAG: hypothetical protein PHY09_13335 [Desulfuromonadaceae bacterium]|nr:hypothetical protein [Desulfuromonadaceae bacterium]MDD5107702.1 hypothetical protein [Desulfuromonadaceae bacterium]